MKINILIAREIKDWIDFFIRNIPGRIGYLLRSQYLNIRLKKTFKGNRFESGLRIELST